MMMGEPVTTLACFVAHRQLLRSELLTRRQRLVVSRHKFSRFGRRRRSFTVVGHTVWNTLSLWPFVTRCVTTSHLSSYWELAFSQVLVWTQRIRGLCEIKFYLFMIASKTHNINIYNTDCNCVRPRYARMIDKKPRDAAAVLFGLKFAESPTTFTTSLRV